MGLNPDGSPFYVPVAPEWPARQRKILSFDFSPSELHQTSIAIKSDQLPVNPGFLIFQSNTDDFDGSA